MDCLLYRKSQIKFLERYMFATAVRSYGQMAEGTAIELARQAAASEFLSEPLVSSRETAYKNEHGQERVIVAGLKGHLIFREDLGLMVSKEYNETPAFINRRGTLIELIEYTFYGGHNLTGIIAQLDNQILAPQFSFRDTEWFVSRHQNLAEMQRWRSQY